MADSGIYDQRRCQYNYLYKRIYKQCNCILKYVNDIHEFFPAVENYRKVMARHSSTYNLFSSCTVLQQAECVSPIVVGWDWTTSHYCPEACFRQFYIQKNIQVISHPFFQYNINLLFNKSKYVLK